MATIKSYADIEQSNKLAEILPLESADMAYIKHSSSDNPTWEFNEDFPPMTLGNVPINEMTVEALPCWSIAALFGVLPKNLNIGSPSLGSNYKGYYWIQYYDEFLKPNNYKTGCFNNPVDACYEMILKLHELKML